MENVNENFDYNKVMNKIKAECPVHIINFDINCMNAIAGFYLMSNIDIESYLKKVTDKSNIKDGNSILVFEPRHVMECCQIIFPCLLTLKGINAIEKDPNYIIEELISITLSYPKRYSFFIKSVDDLIDSVLVSQSIKTHLAYKIFMEILHDVWFIPYSKIDEIGNEAMEEYKKHSEDKKE